MPKKDPNIAPRLMFEADVRGTRPSGRPLSRNPDGWQREINWLAGAILRLVGTQFVPDVTASWLGHQPGTGLYPGLRERGHRLRLALVLHALIDVLLEANLRLCFLSPPPPPSRWERAGGTPLAEAGEKGAQLWIAGGRQHGQAALVARLGIRAVLEQQAGQRQHERA